MGPFLPAPSPHLVPGDPGAPHALSQGCLSPTTQPLPALGLTLAEAASLSLLDTRGQRMSLELNKTDGSAGAVRHPGPRQGLAIKLMMS